MQNNPIWHIAPNKPLPLKPYCNQAIRQGVSLIRYAEWQAQADPTYVWGAKVCTRCIATIQERLAHE